MNLKELPALPGLYRALSYADRMYAFQDASVKIAKVRCFTQPEALKYDKQNYVG